MSAPYRKSAVITWDYKEQPDWDKINFALVEQWSAFIYPVDTQSDQFAIVIGPKEMTQTQAQARYEEWWNDGAEE